MGVDAHQVDCPDAFVLRHGKRRQCTIARSPDFGDDSLLHQKVKVEFPNLRHLVHCHEGAFEGVVQRPVRWVRHAQSAHRLVTLLEVSVPQLLDRDGGKVKEERGSAASHRQHMLKTNTCGIVGGEE